MKVLTYEEAQLHNTAVALGKFQGLHRGHLLLIDRIHDLGETEALDSVVFTININNSKMINTKKDREDILAGLGLDYEIDCDFTPEFAAMEPYNFIREVLYKKLGAKYVVVGTDFCFGCKRAGNIDTLLRYEKEFGYKVIAVEKLSIQGKIVSSSLIREYIQQGRLEEVASFMGRNYYIKGRVTKGRQLGRTIGFPTINQYPPENKLLPPYGAYESKVYIGGIAYHGITNIGDNPTISENNKVTVETHIIDYEGDLYNQDLKVEFIRYIREQKKYRDVDELRSQLLLDKEKVMHQ